MDSNSAAEAFPGVYRAILDGVAELERIGLRDEAHRVRRAATAAYSGPWGEAGYRRLILLVARIERTLAAPAQAIPTRRRPGPRAPEAPGLQALLRRIPSAR
jgi:hypothetical protein